MSSTVKIVLHTEDVLTPWYVEDRHEMIDAFASLGQAKFFCETEGYSLLCICGSEKDYESVKKKKGRGSA